MRPSRDYMRRYATCDRRLPTNETTGSTLAPSVFVIPEQSLVQHRYAPYSQGRSHKLISVTVDRDLGVRPSWPDSIDTAAALRMRLRVPSADTSWRGDFYSIRCSLSPTAQRRTAAAKRKRKRKRHHTPCTRLAGTSFLYTLRRWRGDTSLLLRLLQSLASLSVCLLTEKDLHDMSAAAGYSSSSGADGSAAHEPRAPASVVAREADGSTPPTPITAAEQDDPPRSVLLVPLLEHLPDLFHTSFQVDFGPRFWVFSSFLGVLKKSYRLWVRSI
jgi:hypothetical protein